MEAERRVERLARLRHTVDEQPERVHADDADRRTARRGRHGGRATAMAGAGTTKASDTGIRSLRAAGRVAASMTRLRPRARLAP